jgi:prepilin-type N-terminal cleavage/methylation domain-containing protein/prepilin-type processing-associated H-X9-DG protein
MKRRAAFTLIELLVVVAIISVLISLLLPAIQSAREQARRGQCVNNLLQLGIAFGNYASTHQVFPPGVVNDKGPISNLPRGYHFGWAVQILPYMEKENIYRRFDFRESVYSEANDTARGVHIPTYFCPSSTAGGMAYAGCHHDVEAPIDVDNNGILYLNSRVRRDDITDGPASTILIGEIGTNVLSVASAGWASGTRSSLRNTGHRINRQEQFPTPKSAGNSANSLAGRSTQADLDDVAELVEDGVLPADLVGGFSSHHSLGANFLMADGNVRFIKESVSANVFRLLGNRRDGDLISDDSY